MNNEDRARVWIKHTANNPYEYHKIKLASLLDAAEARGRKQTFDLRNATVAKVERKATIKDCIATARAVMLGHEKEGAPLMATGAVTVEMALEAMLGNISAKAEKK